MWSSAGPASLMLNLTPAMFRQKVKRKIQIFSYGKRNNTKENESVVFNQKEKNKGDVL